MPPTVLRVEAKDVAITMEVSLTFLTKLGKYLDMAVLEYDSSNPEEMKIHEFVMDELYPFVKGTLEGINNGP